MHDRRNDNIDSKSALFGAGIMSLIFIGAFILGSYATNRTLADKALITDSQCIAVIEPEGDPKYINPLEDMNNDAIDPHYRLYMGTEIPPAES